MNFVKALKTAVFCAAGLAALGAKANAEVVPVANQYFDQFPMGQTKATYLTYTDCGTGCAFSDSAIAGWTDSVTTYTRGANAGQWQTGVTNAPPNVITFKTDPLEGGTTIVEPIVARAINATISQVVSTTALAGVTYTLNVDLGFANTQYDKASIFLIVDGHQVLATPAPSDGLTVAQMQLTGSWYDFEASYTAAAADAGKSIEILLSSLTNGQGWGFFGNVQLTDSLTGPVLDPPGTPEPSTWAMILIGFGGMVGAAAMRRSSGRTAAGQLV